MKATIFVSGDDPLNGGLATINWLLDHGMRVTVTGAKDDLLAKRIDEHLKRTARDGDAYEKARARLAWVARNAVPTDLSGLFLSLWKKKVIAITGAHGKTMAAVWAGHLIGDAVVAGHTPERPLVSALDSRAKCAVIEVHGPVPSAKNLMTVSTDELSARDAAVQAAQLAGVSEATIQKRLTTLPQVAGRQEVVHRSAQLTIVNDAMATEPERGIVALRTFGGPTCLLIAGGDLPAGRQAADCRAWAAEVKKTIRPTNLFLLEGSAAKNIRSALGAWGRGIRMYATLADALHVARQRASKFVAAIILFSPAAQSPWKDLKSVLK